MGEVAAGPVQELDLTFGLNAFRHHLEVQAARECNDRFHDCRVIAVRRHMVDEGAIDLERVQREALQVAQAGITGSEVVERES